MIIIKLRSSKQKSCKQKQNRFSPKNQENFVICQEIKAFWCNLGKRIMEAIETTATVQNGIMVDALPYIDLGYDEPGVREAVS